MLDMIADYQAGKREERRLSATTTALLSFRRNSITKPLPPVNSATTGEDDSASATITTNNLAPNPFMIATKPKMEKCVATVAANPAGSSTRPVRRQRRQIRELNECISCCLCNGYLVNATSVDICEHSFCRSCIITYLDSDNNCPQCKPQNRYINLSNLRSDDILRSLVYKLVPGLIQQERERQLQFWKSVDSTSDCDMPGMEEEYIYPAEPISLSLEYHPALLVSCNKSQIPPVRYLQCPAGVTVHHLKRFLCSKYDIDPANQLVDIDIMYEEEILPEDFSLVDVGYCYNWKRVAPMRFYYRILVHNSRPASTPAIRSAEMLTTPPDMKVLGESNQKEAAEAKHVKKSTDSDVMAAPAAKTVRFLEPPKKADKHSEVNRQVTYSVFKSKSMDSKDSSSNQYSTHNNNNNNNNEKEREKNEGNGTMKMIIARKQSPKRSSSDESIYNITNDFKSLRSNDMRYSDYTVTSTTSGGTTTLTKKSKEDSKPLVTKCDIVVSIPQSQISRSPNSSDESTENISLAALKTANKKSSPSSNSTPKKNVPKLKIELNSLKTKITIPKPKSAEIRQEPRKVSKRKLSIDDRPGFDRVDLKTYAKHIGLKPIEMEKSPDPLAKTKVSPDASPMSTASSTGSSTSNGTFSFTANDGCSSFSSSHKKRKKKHSKEPKDSNGKRRKLHAEISSQTADESLKMKVKITGSHNHRPHKVEARKSSSSSDDVVVTTPATAKLSPPAAASLKPTLNGTEQRKSPKQAPSPPTPAPQPPGQIAGAVQNIMPMLNRSIAKEPSKTSGEMDRRESEHSKKPTESKPKPSSPQIMTTIHSRVPSTTQTTSTSTSTCASTSSSTATTTSCSKLSLPKPLANFQEMKIPASPPLPPSLFKTTPLTIPTITPTTTKPTPPPPKPQRTSFANQPNRPPKLAPAPAPPAKTQFAVPQAPAKATPNTSKITPISSIASSAHKHAAQLKRSASVDGPHPTGLLTKQQKLDQDRMIRKSAYGPMSQHEPQRHPKTSTSSSSTSTSSKSSSKPYYSSSMSSSYTQEMSKRKPPPMLMPPSSISVTKAPHSSSSTNATIGASQQKKLYPHQNNQKPSVEIVRVPPSSQPMEHKPTPTKSSPPKATRPPPPPIPLVKIKKPVNQPIPTRSPALTVSTKTTSGHSQPSPPGLISMRSIIPAIVASKSAATIAENAPKQPEKSSPETNGKPPKEKSSSSACKDRRPSSRDGSVEILDLSSGKQMKSPPTPSTPTSAGNSLEAALNKIKQNITSSTVPDSIAAANNKSSKADNSPEDLQNLHLLSESATSREKIAIKTLPKLNEISKVRSGQAPVRQQNASVRNIPNPSALAFRNLPQPPMLNSISSNAAAPPSPPVGAAKPEFKIPTPPNSSPSSSTNPGSPPRLKKNLNIEQVAANLNMRAAAAADKSEALSTTGATVAASVSSTSRQEPKPPVVTSSNVVSSSSSSSSSSSASASSLSLTSSSTSLSSSTAKISREPSVTPTPPKTSFKSISSLVASSSPSSKTVSAGSA